MEKNIESYKKLSKLNWNQNYPLNITAKKLLPYLNPKYINEDGNLFESVEICHNITPIVWNNNIFDLYIYSLNGLYKEKLCKYYLLNPPHNKYINKYRIVGDYAEVQVRAIKMIGLKVMDVFKIFNSSKQIIRHKNILQQIKKIKRHNSSSILQDYQKFNNIDDFGNSVVLFEHYEEFSELFKVKYSIGLFELEKPIEDLMKDYVNIIEKMFKSINKNFVENLINVHFIDKDVYIEKEDIKFIIFSKPKSLLSILNKYHSESKEYHLLRNMIKPNNKKRMYLLNSMEIFSRTDAEIMDIKYYNKIYLKSWNFGDKFYSFGNFNYQEIYHTDFSYIASIINKKYKNLQKQNNLKFIYEDYEEKYKFSHKSIWCGYKIKDINKNRSKKLRYHKNLIRESFPFHGLNL